MKLTTRKKTLKPANSPTYPAKEQDLSLRSSGYEKVRNDYLLPSAEPKMVSKLA